MTACWRSSLRQEHAGLRHGDGPPQRSSVFVYGGSILPGNDDSGANVDIASIFEAVGQYQGGTADAARVYDVECNACPAQGPAAACIPPTP